MLHEKSSQYKACWSKLKASEVKELFEKTGFTNDFWSV